MIFPLLFIGGGVAAIVAAIAAGSDEGMPVAPLESLPEPDPVVTDTGTTIDPAVTPTPASAIDPDDAEALARVLASEAGSGTRAEQLGIGWTVRNHFRNKSIYDGEYPWRSQNGGHPPFSSSQDANAQTRALAQQILAAPFSQDVTGGATSFFEPRMQDAFAQAGAMARAGQTGNATINGVKLTDITRFKNYKSDAQGIRDRWSPGSCLYATAGRFEFWGSTSQFNKNGSSVKTIVGGAGAGVAEVFTDIPDPLALLPKYRRRG